MKTNDLFKQDRTAKKLNEGIDKTFGKKLNLESFDLPKLEDARNKLRTQIHVARGSAEFNENLENDAYHEAQWMLDVINAEIAERQEFIADAHTADVTYEDDSEGADPTFMGTVKNRRTGVELDVHAAEPADEQGRRTNTMIYLKDPATGKVLHKFMSSREIDANYDWVRYPSKNEGVDEQEENDVDYFFTQLAKSGDEAWDILYDAQDGKYGKEVEKAVNDMYTDVASGRRLHSDDDFEAIYDIMIDRISDNYGESIETVAYESAPPGKKYERMVKHIKKGYAKDGKLTPKEKSIAYATAWKEKNKESNEDVNEDQQVDELKRSTVKSYAVKKLDKVKSEKPETLQKVGKDLTGLKNAQARLKGERPTSESIEGENMTKLYEGEIQQAQSIVTAKTMVDRVGRWIEELSGMENDTLLTLGDQIRDEMSADQAKQFISVVAPAIQQALTSLKSTRETLATGVRTLTGEEQGAEMLGANPPTADVASGAELGPDMGDEFGGEAEPDMMNAPEETGDEIGDAFAAAEPGAGGAEAAGRAKRESIDLGNRLLKVLAG